MSDTITPEQRAAATIGAQIILDFNDDTSKGARGGAGATMEENTAARDAGLIGLGLDPVNCSGPPPSQEQLAARKAAADAAASATPQFYPPPSGHATKTSSLAAGIDAGDVPPPPDTLSGGSGV